MMHFKTAPARRLAASAFAVALMGSASALAQTEVKLGYGVVMATALISWFIGVSLFMTTPKMRAVFSRASKWIDRTSGVVFIALGLKLAAEKAH